MANSAKSNSSYKAINNAQKLVQKTGNLPVPLSLRNASTKLMKDLNYSKNYKYSHDYVDNFFMQEFMPKEISKTKLYEPSDNNREKKFREILKKRWKGKYNF